MVDWVERVVVVEPWKYNSCRFCGSPIEKPREFCDEICERGFRVKSVIPELADIPVGGVNKAKFRLILGIAEALKSGRREGELRAHLGFFYSPRTLNHYFSLARRLIEVEEKIK